MELLIIILISLMLIISSFITTLLSVKVKKATYMEKELSESRQPRPDNIETISTGYAYSVDVGDSMVIVVVMDKKNSSNNFLGVQPIPIKVHGIEDVEQHS